MRVGDWGVRNTISGHWKALSAVAATAALFIALGVWAARLESTDAELHKSADRTREEIGRHAADDASRWIDHAQEEKQRDETLRGIEQILQKQQTRDEIRRCLASGRPAEACL